MDKKLKEVQKTYDNYFAARKKLMLKMRAKGLNNREIGREFNISGERVGQIFKSLGVS